MSLDKAILHKKEKRKPYYGAKAIDPSCRNHGSDSWSETNRRFSELVNNERLNQEEKEFKKNDDCERIPRPAE